MASQSIREIIEPNTVSRWVASWTIPNPRNQVAPVSRAVVPYW